MVDAEVHSITGEAQRYPQDFNDLNSVKCTAGTTGNCLTGTQIDSARKVLGF